MPAGKSKIRQQDTTTCQLEWPKSRKLITPNDGEDVPSGDSPTLQCKCKVVQPLWKTVGQGFCLFFFPKITLTIQSRNCTFWYLLKGIESVCPPKNLHMDVYSQLFIIAKACKQPRCPWYMNG